MQPVADGHHDRIAALDDGADSGSAAAEAERLSVEMAGTFDRAIEVADALLASTDPLAVRFRPETLPAYAVYG